MTHRVPVAVQPLILSNAKDLIDLWTSYEGILTSRYALVPPFDAIKNVRAGRLRLRMSRRRAGLGAPFRGAGEA